jgi:hypothetical protein
MLAVSELVPIPAFAVASGYNAGLVFQVTASTSAAWSPGTVTLYLDFFNSAGTYLSSYTQSSSATAVSATPVAITTSAITSLYNTGAAYMCAVIEVNGSPPVTTQISVSEAQIYDAYGVGYNSNISFVYNYAPWSSGSTTTTVGTSTLASPVNVPQWAGSTQQASLTWQNTGTPNAVDSLVLGGLIELLGGAQVQSQIPELIDSNGHGAIFQLLAPPSTNSMAFGFEQSYDYGAPQPTQDIVESMLLDGERPFGYRSSNRTLTLPVQIVATSNQQLQTAREYLLWLIDQQTWKITYTPGSTGLATVFDCFRALPSQIMWGFNYDNSMAQLAQQVNSGYSYVGEVTLNIQALPYGRSDTDGTQTLAFPSPLQTQVTGAGPLQVDGFSSLASGMGSNHWYLRTNQGMATAYASTTITSNAVYYQPPTPIQQPYPAAVYTKGGLAIDIRQRPTLSVWIGQAYDSAWATDRKFLSDMTVAWSLTDSNNKTITFHYTYNQCPWSTDANNPKWTRISAQIPQGVAGFNYESIQSYTLTLSNSSYRGKLGIQRMKLWVSNIIANPLAAQAALTNSNRAAVYNLVGFAGTARTPVSAQFQLASAAPASQELYGSGVWYPPPGVYSAQVEAIGAGGGGGSTTATGVAGGGGGGEYAQEPALPVTPGQAIPYSCGTGGLAAQQPVTITFSTAGTGSWLCPANVTSIQVECWGGGSAGAAGAGGGAGGGYSKDTITVAQGNSYKFVVGAGGVANSGTTAQLIAARGGNKSYFLGASGGGMSGEVIAYGASTSRTGSSPGGGGGAASSNTVSFAGGSGGASPGSGGGGGGASGSSTGSGGAGGTANSTSGGAGGTVTGAGAGGPGGAGASTPGLATAGTSPGGGGGGGCTTGSANQLGANGAPGQVKITYTVNGSVVVNGSATTFGSTATTGTVVTANGGATVTTGTVTGAAGGSGSTNTYHAPGGQGGWQNLLSPTLATLQMTNLIAAGSVNFTGSSSNTAFGTAVPYGTIIVTVLTAAPISGAVTVSDSTTQNVYSLVTGPDTIGNTGSIYVFAAPVLVPVTTSMSFTVTTGAAGTYSVQAWGCPSEYGVDTGSVNSATGSSATGAVTFGTGGNGTNDFQVVILANNSNVSLSATPAAPLWNAPSGNSLTNGNLRCYTYVAQSAGTAAASANTATGTWASSTTWGAVAIPLYLSYSQQPPIVVAHGSVAAGTSIPIALTNAQAIPANGCLVVACAGTAASTMSVADNASGGSNTYTLEETVTATSVMKVFVAQVADALTTASTITITDSTSQTHIYGVYYVPGATAFDVGNSLSTQGASSSPAITNTTMSAQTDIELAFFYNNSDANYATPLNNWTTVDSESDGAAKSFGVFAYQSVSTAGTAATVTQGSSVAWGAAVIGLKMPVAGGGGGSSGGYNAATGSIAGQAAIYSTGATAFLGGGKGASGTAQSGNGSTGTPPGGGGSGSVSSGTAETGGQGGNGLCVVTWQPPLQPFSALIVHRPGPNAPPSLNPAVPLGNTNDTPTNIQYPVQSLITGVNALFNGTYSVVLSNYQWNSPTVTRQITVNVTQYEYQGGPSYTQSTTRTLTPSTDVSNGIVMMGELTLPMKAVDPSSTSAYFMVSIVDTNTSDQFLDVLFLDTQGQTAIINIPSGNAGYGTYNNYFLDEPGLNTDLGLVLGSAMDRAQAVSVLDSAIISGGPLYVDSGSNVLLAYSPSGAPSLGLSFNPRWFSSRLY